MQAVSFVTSKARLNACLQATIGQFVAGERSLTLMGASTAIPLGAKSQPCHLTSRYYQDLTPATVTQLRWHGSKNAGRPGDIERSATRLEPFQNGEVLAYSLNASQMSDESGPRGVFAPTKILL